MNFGKSETRIDQNDKVSAKITCFFGAVKPPRSGPSETALRLRSLPEGGPPLGEIFSKSLVKINDFLMEIVIILIRVVFFD